MPPTLMSGANKEIKIRFSEEFEIATGVVKKIVKIYNL